MRLEEDSFYEVSRNYQLFFLGVRKLLYAAMGLQLVTNAN